LHLNNNKDKIFSIKSLNQNNNNKFVVNNLSSKSIIIRIHLYIIGIVI